MSAPLAPFNRSHLGLPFAPPLTQSDNRPPAFCQTILRRFPWAPANLLLAIAAHTLSTPVITLFVAALALLPQIPGALFLGRASNLSAKIFISPFPIKEFPLALHCIAFLLSVAFLLLPLPLFFFCPSYNPADFCIFFLYYKSTLSFDIDCALFSQSFPFCR